MPCCRCQFKSLCKRQMNGIKQQNKIAFWGCIILIPLIVVYFIYNPNDHIFPKCMFFQLTGLQCPGCGSQRAIHQLLHGNLVEAYHYNALLVMSIPWMLAIFFAHLCKWERKERLNRIILHRNVVNAYLLIFVCWWIFRNIV